MQFEIPRSLSKVARYPTGAEWLLSLPKLIEEVSENWSLQLGKPFEGSFLSYVVRARYKSEDVVLKIQWPHEECIYEAEALKQWNGDGAIHLVEHDPSRHALLLEYCLPGTHLGNDRTVDPIKVLTGLLPRLWKPAGDPFKPLAAEAELWAATLLADWESAGRPCEKIVVDAALAYLADLPKSQGQQVLVHQDLHGDNVLAAEREPWLAIDPKPLRGEREFALAPIVRSPEFGHSRAETTRRLDALTSELGLDRERARCWTIAQTVAWAFDAPHSKQHLQVAQWLLAA